MSKRLTLLRTFINGLNPRYADECPACDRTIRYYGVPDYVYRVVYHALRHHT